MSIHQHTSVPNALTLAPALFFLNIGTIDGELPMRAENLAHIHTRMEHYIARASDILDKPRTGWTRKERGIPTDEQETIGAHMLKVGIAGTKIPDGLVKWCISRGIEPSAELVELFYDIHSRIRLSRKGFFHDFQEWGHNPDLTPGEATQEDKDRIEYAAVREYASTYGDNFPLQMYESMLEKNLENELIFNLDKMDAAVMALNYDRVGYNVGEFFPYALEKFTIPMMREILETLIRYKTDYPNIDFFIQYDSLLFHGGNIGKWRSEMDARARHGPAWELFHRLDKLQARDVARAL